jgi:hypothetical protein
MNTLNSDAAKEPVYEDFRQLFARKEKLLAAEQRGRSPIRLLRMCLGRGIERAADLLQGRLILLLAVCLSLVLAVMSVFLMHGAQRSPELSADVQTGSSVKQAPLRRNSMGILTDAKDFAEDRTVADRPSHSLPEDSIPETHQTFIIRVGSFRNPSNAERVAESLRERRLDVKTQVMAGGLHVVKLGPFPQKSAAEDAARSVQEAIGLTPQVLRLDVE